MDWLATTLQRLITHFHEVEIGPPADPRDVAALRSRFGSIPDDLDYYYSQCDGVTVDLRDDVVGRLFPLKVSLKEMPIALDYEAVRRFLPIREDGCGDYDCVVLGQDIGEGCVVFWDHEIHEGPAYLLGGSFSAYFQMWADHLVTCHLPDGEEDSRYIAPSLDQWPWMGQADLEHPWPFNESWMKSRDSKARELLNDPESRRWLLGQDNLRRQLSTGGDDGS